LSVRHTSPTGTQVGPIDPEIPHGRISLLTD